MTNEDHNKALGIMHLIYGGFFSLMVLVMALVMVFVFGAIAGMPPNPGGDPFGPAFVAAIMAFVFGFYLLLAAPALVAGYALLRHKSWARTAGIVSAFFAAMSFPFGTALCVYSLWFFFGKGQKFYESEMFRGPAVEQLPGADLFASLGDKGWERNEGRVRQREFEYIPPPQPPDWRG